jgi:putative membrane protein
VIAASLALAAVAYALAMRRTRRWSAWRALAFAAGLLVAALALAGPGGGLSAHMAEHVLLTLVAAPLLILGAPHTLATRALGQRAARPLRRLGLLAWPPLAWLAFAAATLGVHLTGLFEYALDHEWAHALEHVALFSTALAFWAPVLAAPPAPRTLGPVARLAYLMSAMAPMGAVGAVLVNAGDPVYVRYSVEQQADAGAAMWVGGGFVLVFATVVAAWVALEREERRQRARERYEDAG